MKRIFFLIFILFYQRLWGLENLDEIAMKVYRNECSAKPENLIHWNQGEAFLSLGIGHFIWYPEGKRAPFEERFPLFVEYCRKHQVALCSIVNTNRSCPWNSRDAFLKDKDAPDVLELRQFLLDTKSLQMRFMVERIDTALLPDANDAVKRRFHELLQTPEGLYAVVDYVNFKGEGNKPSERYNNQGWGLLQVLEQMDDKQPLLVAFRDAAKQTLLQRVDNSPPERNEVRWLKGWLNRCDTYIYPNK